MNVRRPDGKRIVSKASRTLTEEREFTQKVSEIKGDAIEKVALSLIRKEYKGKILSVERESSLVGIDPTGFTLGVKERITEEIELELDDSTKVIIVRKS